MFNFCTVKNFDIFQRAHTVPAKTVVHVRTQDPRTCARVRLGIQETSVKWVSIARARLGIQENSVRLVIITRAQLGIQEPV